MTHQIYFRAVIAMSPESLLLNALRCHLVFAGSLRRAGGGRAAGAVWSRALALLCSTIFSEAFACQPQKRPSGGFTFSTQNPWKVLRIGNEPSRASGICAAEYNLGGIQWEVEGMLGRSQCGLVSCGSSDRKEDPRLAVTPSHHPLVWKSPP